MTLSPKSLDSEQFWEQVVAATAARRELSIDDRRRIAERAAEVDAAFVGVS
ncbi:MAG: hypothetical protein ABIR32_12300 [Ilumatobacteraceae bacterium]